MHALGEACQQRDGSLFLAHSHPQDTASELAVEACFLARGQNFRQAKAFYQGHQDPQEQGLTLFCFHIHVRTVGHKSAVKCISRMACPLICAAHILSCTSVLSQFLPQDALLAFDPMPTRFDPFT